MPLCSPLTLALTDLRICDANLSEKVRGNFFEIPRMQWHEKGNRRRIV